MALRKVLTSKYCRQCCFTHITKGERIYVGRVGDG